MRQHSSVEGKKAQGYADNTIVFVSRMVKVN